MEISVDITRDDYAAFQKHAQSRASAAVRRPHFALLVVAWVFTVVLFTWFYTATPWAPAYIFSCGIGIALGMVLFYWDARLQQAGLVPEEDAYVCGPRTLIAGEDGLRVRSEKSELWLSPSAIRRIEQTAEHVFVYVDRAAAVIVPKRAFGSSEEMSAFVAALAGKAGC